MEGVYFFFFFFKQKTAYEIYQCDWSSDVCSSDLSCPVLLSDRDRSTFVSPFGEPTLEPARPEPVSVQHLERLGRKNAVRPAAVGDDLHVLGKARQFLFELVERNRERSSDVARLILLARPHIEHDRSEEHTSELQSH